MTPQAARSPWRLLPGPFLLVLLGLDVAALRGGPTRFDPAIILALRTPGHLVDPLGPPWLAETGRDLTGLGSNSVMALVVVTGCGGLMLAYRRRHAAALLLASGSALVGNGLFKLAVHRARPDLIPEAPRVFTTSFPSSHAMLSAATLFTLAAIAASGRSSPALRVFCFAMAAVGTGLIGFSRVYLGVHWPSDVLGGWAAGLFCAWASWMTVGRDPGCIAPPSLKPRLMREERNDR